MNFAVQDPPTAVISARTSRCYCNTINNKMPSIPIQKQGKHNTSKIQKQLVVVDNLPPSGSSQRKKNHSALLTSEAEHRYQLLMKAE